MKNTLRLLSGPSSSPGSPITFSSRPYWIRPAHFLTGLLLVGLSTLSWGQPCFNTSTIPLTPTGNPVASPPFAEAAGDFNGDGKPDLAVAGGNMLGTVSVLLNTGSGSFGPQINYELGFGFFPSDIAVADVNGDGKPDLAVTGTGGNNVAVLLNTGGGTFGAAALYPVGTMPQSIAVGDFNADSKPDLAIANQTSSNVSVLLNLGNGIFGAATNFAVASTPFSIVAGDFNSDGKPDLVVANGGGAVSFLPGTGGGAFGTYVYIPLTNIFSVPRQMKTGDFNGDNKPDLALIDHTDNIQILLGNGAGGFGFAPATGPTGGRSGLTIGDFNGDGKADLASTAYSAATVFIQLGNGDGTFQAATSITAGASPSAILSADFNGDGKLDLSVINGGANATVLLGNGDGTFIVAGAVINPISVVVADFNKDGKPDMAVASFNSNNVSVLLNNGSGGFGTATNFMAGSEPTSVATGDFNKDGNPDLAVTNLTSDNISILLGSGTGNFGMAPNVTLKANSSPETVAVGDVNGDGNPDLISANASNGVSIVLGKGDGSFGAATNLSFGDSYQGVAVGDFNGDAYTDFVVTNYGTSSVTVFFSDGKGSISGRSGFAVGAQPVSVAVGDFNGDGKADLAVANLGSKNISVLLGAGNGIFSAATNYASSNPYSIVISDFNGDGKLDLAVTNNTTDNVSILPGNGSGGFGAATSFAVGDYPVSSAVGDFNGDGKADLVTANYSSNNVTLLLNCAPPVSMPPVVSGPFAITSVTTLGCTPAGNRINVAFNPQYAGINGQPITFRVINETLPTTNPGPYSVGLYTDNPVINLEAIQSGVTTTFAYNWLNACSSPPPGNTTPTVANTIPNQMGTVGQAFNYTTPANTFTDAETPGSLVLSASGLPAGLNLAGSVISGTPLASGTSTVTITATDPGSLFVSTTFTITINPAVGPPPSGTFSIMSVTTISCTPAGNRINVAFNPQYAGINGQPITFRVINETLPTTNPGPYSVGLYTDNPVINLEAIQSGVTTTFAYNWRAACGLGTRIAAEPTAELQVRLLGNPVQNAVDFEVMGAEGNALTLSLTDMQGRIVNQKQVEQSGPIDRLRFDVSTQPAGVLLLHVSTPDQTRTVRVLKVN